MASITRREAELRARLATAGETLLKEGEMLLAWARGTDDPAERALLIGESRGLAHAVRVMAETRKKARGE